jgi:hypothetical protein
VTLSIRSHFEVARDVQARRFDDELVVLDLARGEYFSLDEVGSKVWEGLAAGRTLEDIVAAFALEYEADAPRIAGDVLAFVVELVGKRLLVEKA